MGNYKGPMHTCPECGTVGEITLEDPNFKCKKEGCGYTQHIIMRRELLDLNDPVECELAMRIVAGCLKT
jgi:hypothetical protein